MRMYKCALKYTFSSCGMRLNSYLTLISDRSGGPNNIFMNDLIHASIAASRRYALSPHHGHPDNQTDWYLGCFRHLHPRNLLIGRRCRQF